MAGDSPRFDCVFYYVSDLDRAIEFYTTILGFRLRDMVARHAAVALVAVGCLLAAGTTGADDLARETAVFTAAARQQLKEQLNDEARARGAVLCVGINPGEAPQSPSPEFMSGLGGDKALRRLSECDPRPRGAVESATSRPAVIVTVGPIEWRADDEAWVTVTYFRSRGRSGIRRYRVVHEPSGWVSLGPILLDGPV